MGALENLAKKFATFCERQDSLPVVRLEEFFEGNEARYSMGANLSNDERNGWIGNESSQLPNGAADQAKVRRRW